MKRTHRFLGAAALVSLAAACQLIVSGDLPTYRCTGDNPSSCPTGLVCNPFGNCAPPDESVDAGRDARTVGEDGDAGVGTECVVDTDCNAGLICGTSTLLTTSIVPQGSKPVCTKPCCTSEECPAGNVCFASGTGSNFCVAAIRAGARVSARNLPGGSACTIATDCRSGFCTGRCANDANTTCTSADDCGGNDCVQQQCLDTCCHATDCAAGSVCRAFAGTAHAAWACGAPDVLLDGGPSGDVGALCKENYQCKSANCAFGVYPDSHCTPSCCSSNDCAALGNYACGYGQLQNKDYLKWCFAPKKDAIALGGSCTISTDCATSYCDPDDGKCRSTCCSDTDCPVDDAGVAERCLPSPSGAPQLRCKK